ncbi:MAG: hypothetical protein ACREGR_04660 [Minisyncoccia bacterium]
MAVRKVVVAVEKSAREGRSYDEYTRLARTVAFGAVVEGMAVVSDFTGYEGQVLAAWNEIVRVMSDVWDDVMNYRVWTENGPVVVGPGGGLGYRDGEFKYLPGLEQPAQDYDTGVVYEVVTDWKVDATEDVMARFAEYEVARREREAEEARKREEARQVAEAEKERRTVRRGKLVRVNRGRKVPKGTEGVCVWVGSGTYGDRVGVATSDRKGPDGRYLDVAWTALSNVDVVLPEDEVAEVEPAVEPVAAPVVEAPVTVVEPVAAPVVEAPAAPVTPDVAALLLALSQQVAALSAEVAELKKPKARKPRKAKVA